MKNQTILTGDIEVRDVVISYSATLKGDWTERQVLSAFADGYDTGDLPDGATVAVTVCQGGDIVGSGDIVADGHGGVKNEIGDYPHSVKWNG